MWRMNKPRKTDSIFGYFDIDVHEIKINTFVE